MFVTSPITASPQGKAGCLSRFSVWPLLEMHVTQKHSWYWTVYWNNWGKKDFGMLIGSLMGWSNRPLAFKIKTNLWKLLQACVWAVASLTEWPHNLSPAFFSLLYFLCWKQLFPQKTQWQTFLSSYSGQSRDWCLFCPPAAAFSLFSCFPTLHPRSDPCPVVRWLSLKSGKILSLIPFWKDIDIWEVSKLQPF